MMKIGFIGTGVMGASIVKHLLAAQHEVTIYTRTKAKAEPLLTAGAKWADSPQACAENQEVVFTMVGYPQDVKEVMAGIFQAAQQGAIIIDMTTSEPTLAQTLYTEAKVKNLSVLDAPVSGGDIGAQNGTLSIMVGGDKAAFDHVYPVLTCFGETVVYQGEAGAGQHAKMCNQIVIASGMIGVCEALAYGLKAGLTMEDVLRSITTGAAGSWALTNLAPRMLKGDYAPGFYIKHIVKDLGIALAESERMALELPGLALAHEMYTKLLAAGYGEEGTQALIRYYDEL